jgi:hypothetical protein
MDHDDKVNSGGSAGKELARQNTSIFFDQKIREVSADHKVYNIFEEFAKTRNNRSMIVPLVITAMVILLGAVAIIVTQYINRSIRAQPVDIQAFEDINLKDLLDVAKRNQQEMDKVAQDLEKLNFDYKAELDQIESDKNAALDTNALLKLPSADLNSRNAAARAEAAKKAQAVRDKYEPLIAQKKKEQATIQAKVNAYDTQAMAKAQENAAILDSQKRLFDENMKNQKNYYEQRIAEIETTRSRQIADAEKQKDDLAKSLVNKYEGMLADQKKQYETQIASLIAKYNPTFNDQRSIDLLAKTQGGSNAFAQKAYPAVLGKENLMSEADYKALAQNMDDFLYVSGKLRSVPYINSVPNALSQLEEKGVSTAAVYQGAVESLAKTLNRKNDLLSNSEAMIRDRDARIDRFNYALSYYTSDLREVGIIVDPRDRANITLFLSPAYSVTDGMTGWIFRYDDNFIGSVRFKQKGADITAAAKDIVPGKTISPFDKILLEVESPEALLAQQPKFQVPVQEAAPAAPPATPASADPAATQNGTAPVSNADNTQKGGQ